MVNNLALIVGIASGSAAVLAAVASALISWGMMRAILNGLRTLPKKVEEIAITQAVHGEKLDTAAREVVFLREWKHDLNNYLLKKLGPLDDGD